MIESADAPRTARDIIDRSLQFTPIGEGHEAAVYPLALPGYEGRYVLRAPRDPDKLRQALLDTTSLTPVDYRLPPSLAPALLKSDNGKISIHARHLGPGKGLRTLWQERMREYYDAEGFDQAAHHAYVDILGMIERMPQKAYDEMLHNMAALTKEGYGLDFCNNNLLTDADSQTMRWVDYERPKNVDNWRNDIGPHLNHLKNVEAELLYFHSGAWSYKDDAVATLQAGIRTKLDEAARKTGVPADHIEAMARLEREPPVFRSVSAIESVPAVPLSATSAEFRISLERASEHIERNR
jgi:hypothetical protein